MGQEPPPQHIEACIARPLHHTCVSLQLHLADGRVLAARLVVAADGAGSRIRGMAGLRTWGWGYGQRGLVATVTTSGVRHGDTGLGVITAVCLGMPVSTALSGVGWAYRSWCC